MPVITPQSPFRASSPRGSLLRSTAPIAAGILVLVALSGCSAEPSGTDATSKPTSGATSSTSDPEATATPTPTPVATGTPVALSCTDILSPDDVYAYNPNYGTDPAFAPTGTGETAVQYDGVACGWINQTSSDTFEVSVAQPNDVLRVSLIDAALASGQAVPTYGPPPLEGFFSPSTGTAEVFSGDYWVTVSSEDMKEPGDAQQLVDAVLSHLG